MNQLIRITDAYLELKTKVKIIEGIGQMLDASNDSVSSKRKSKLPKLQFKVTMMAIPSKELFQILSINSQCDNARVL